MDRLAQLMMEPTPVTMSVMISKKLEDEIIILADRMGWKRSRAIRYLLWLGIAEVKRQELVAQL